MTDKQKKYREGLKEKLCECGLPRVANMKAHRNSQRHKDMLLIYKPEDYTVVLKEQLKSLQDEVKKVKDELNEIQKPKIVPVLKSNPYLR
jgi:hypothetical protein